MGTIAQKLTYLNGTKQALKESINNLGGDITSETTFRNYVEELEEIYDNLPKTDYAEGSNITLSNTLKGKLDYENEIVGYGDTQQETTTGTQRADTNESIAETTTNGITYSLKDGIFKLNGTCTKAFNIALTNVVSLESGAYSFGISDVSGAYGGVIGKYMDNSSGTIMLEGGQLRNTTKSSLSESYDNLHARLYIAKDVAANNLSFKLNLVKGTYTSDTMPAWEPYTNGASPNPNYPQEIEVVTGTQEVKVENKNLLDYTKYVTRSVYGVTATNNNDGSITLNGTASNTSFIITESSTNYMTLEPGTYTLSANNSVATGGTSGQNTIRLLKTDQTSVIGSSVCTMNTINATATFTLTETTDCFLQVRTQSGNTYTDFVIKPQLEKGSTATDFVVHQEQVQTISLGDIELCKIGTYQDYLYKSNDKWYKKEYIGKYTFTGNEKWFKHSTTSNNLFYISPVYNPIVSNMKKPSTNNVALECYSEMAQYKAVNTMAGNSVIGINPSVAGDIYVGTSLSGISDRDVFKTYLQNHITNFYYLLENSSDIEITNTTLIEQLDNLEKMKSYNGQTNIEVVGDLPMIMKVRALKGE